MTRLVERPGQAGAGGGAARGLPGGAAVPSALVATPPKPRRRWGLFAAMVLVVCLGALGNVWLHAASTTAQLVVVARSTIERGAVITAEDLMTVRIEVDPSLHTVPGGDLAGLVGGRAALDVAAGSLLTPESVTQENVPPAGYSLVGVGVTQSMMPGTQLMAGDEIRVVATADQQGGTSTAATPVSVTATVVGTQTGVDTTGLGAETIITVQVPTGDAAQLAAMASAGKVAVVLDSRDR
jgi:hypothetical protein